MDERERYFLETFIRKDRKERLLYQFGSEKKRYEALDRFCHDTGKLINKSLVIMQGEKLESDKEFEKFCNSHNEECLMISPDGFLDNQVMVLKEAVKAALMCFDAVIVIGKGFAFIKEESMKGGTVKYLLKEHVQ